MIIVNIKYELEDTPYQYEYEYHYIY